MINLVLFGPPGSGKGTQAVKMAEQYELLHISTGDLFRNAIKEKTEMGLKAKAFMDKGNLVPDEVTIGMMNAIIEENPEVNGIIFDGFPRTVKQAEALDTFLNARKTPISRMIALDVADEELVKRLLNRGKDSGRPDDKDEEIIKNRIAVYNNQTLPVAGFYKAQSKLKHIKGEGSIDDIFGRICDELDQLV